VNRAAETDFRGSLTVLQDVYELAIEEIPFTVEGTGLDNLTP